MDFPGLLGVFCSIGQASRGTYNSLDTRTLLFGLGDATCKATLTVRWPDGRTDVLKDVATNRYLTLDMVKGLSAD